MNWLSIFDDIKPEAAATEAEISALSQRLQHPLPDSYCNFLSWSNGGWARSGEREFGFLDTQSVVEFMETYEFARSMPGAVPYAWDGGGVFYVFDFRAVLIAGECPNLACESGANFWEHAWPIGASFLEVCSGVISIGDLQPPSHFEPK